MKTFTTLHAFREALGRETRWARTVSALETRDIQPDVMYSVGDSLTFMSARTGSLTTGDLVAHRRYHAVVHPVDGDAVVEIAPCASLRPLSAYDDLTDRQTFAGSGAAEHVPRGSVMILETHEAMRVLPSPDVTVVLAHVTVEGVTFHNK
ncbi:beta-galactosidase subunit beta [Curtobacterium pusillum]|uniref:Beta-galactosidase subunit beta n=1 Tax=Curtobacterium pusillum TaxID=69373 RepID=A0ABX2M805_9MICO|nr:beta-galactosidase subunit beta [Curtobacterium pusillum]NUU14192.1 beta-galactosidase subunit beta [Curtobacterium pusillum]GLK29936.1 beta-galactosidase subunit beta [Curtobacterium pusillum]